LHTLRVGPVRSVCKECLIEREAQRKRRAGRDGEARL
jgi:hypothetical protein